MRRPAQVRFRFVPSLQPRSRRGFFFGTAPLVAGLAAKDAPSPSDLFAGRVTEKAPAPSARSPGLSVNPRRLRSGALLFGLAPERMKRSQVLLRQPDLVSVSRPPDIASHAADEVSAAVVDFHERLLAFSATVGHCLRLAREAAASVCVASTAALNAHRLQPPRRSTQPAGGILLRGRGFGRRPFANRFSPIVRETRCPRPTPKSRAIRARTRCACTGR